MYKLIIALILFSASFITNAHPGRTASDGCHYCRTNCEKWNVPYDIRHCHIKKNIEKEGSKPKISKYTYYPYYNFIPIYMDSFSELWNSSNSRNIVNIEFSSEDVTLYHTYKENVYLIDGGYEGYEIEYSDLFLIKYKKESEFKLEAVQLGIQKHSDDGDTSLSDSIYTNFKISGERAFHLGKYKNAKISRLKSDGEYNFIEVTIDVPKEISSSKYSYSFVALGEREVKQESLKKNIVTDYLLASVDIDHGLIKGGINVEYSSSEGNGPNTKIFSESLNDGAIKISAGHAQRGYINTLFTSTFQDSKGYLRFNGLIDKLSNMMYGRGTYHKKNDKKQAIESYAKNPLLVDGVDDEWDNLSQTTTIHDSDLEYTFKYKLYEVNSEKGSTSYLASLYKFKPTSDKFSLDKGILQITFKDSNNKIYKENINASCYKSNIDGSLDKQAYCASPIFKTLMYKLDFNFDKTLKAIVPDKNVESLSHASSYDGEYYYFEVNFPIDTPFDEGLINTDWVPVIDLRTSNATNWSAYMGANIFDSICPHCGGEDLVDYPGKEIPEGVGDLEDLFDSIPEVGASVQVSATGQLGPISHSIEATVNTSGDVSVSTSTPESVVVNTDIEGEFGVTVFDTDDLSKIDSGQSAYVAADASIIGGKVVVGDGYNGVGVTFFGGGMPDVDAGVVTSHRIWSSEDTDHEISDTLRRMREGSEGGFSPIGGDEHYGFDPEDDYGSDPDED